MSDPLKIVFMGTPRFAVPSLRALESCNCVVELVVTQPDRPRGRGRRLAPPPVKEAAVEMGCQVLQPESVRTEDFYDTLVATRPDLFVVVAFGHILPKRILEIPAFGSVNLHASLLPAFRGPAPIHRAIINGETETGVTSMLMDKGLDTGEILLSETVPIRPDDTAGSLHDRLADAAARVLARTISGFESGEIRPIPQNHAAATYAPLLSKSDGRIDWSKPAEEVERFIRGMSPWPGAFTFMGDMRLRIFRAEVCQVTEPRPPGTVIRGFDNELRVACGKDALCLQEIQAESGKRMDIARFLQGKSIEAGTVLE